MINSLSAESVYTTTADALAGVRHKILDSACSIGGVDYNLEQQQRAQQQVFTKLQSIPDLRGVFGTNIWSAQGAYQAVVNAGKRDYNGENPRVLIGNWVYIAINWLQ